MTLVNVSLISALKIITAVTVFFVWWLDTIISRKSLDIITYPIGLGIQWVY